MMFVSLIISCDVCLKSFPLITIWYPISAALSFIYQNLGVPSEPDDNVPYDVCVVDHIQWWSQNISLDRHAVWSHISIWYHMIPHIPSVALWPSWCWPQLSSPPPFSCLRSSRMFSVMYFIQDKESFHQMKMKNIFSAPQDGPSRCLCCKPHW